MIHDAAIPPGLDPAYSTTERRGIYYTAAQWTPQDLESLTRHLSTVGQRALNGIANTELLEAWDDTVKSFRDPDSEERQALDPTLARLCQLSDAGLHAGLEAVLGGVAEHAAQQLQSQAEGWQGDEESDGLVLVVLASNLPGLAVQSLLPALLLRHPVILKSPTSEPLFAPAFVRALTQRLPELETGLAAITWKGGNRALESPVVEAADRILAYGEAEALADLEHRAPGKVFAYGPKTSLAVVASPQVTREVAAGLARDIALFDQRGCLSIQAIFTDGDPISIARLVASELAALGQIWPPGGLDPVVAAGVQQIRSEATLRGLFVADTPLQLATVVIEPEPGFQPTPGMRTVRIQPLAALSELPELLVSWSGQLQGAALEGDAAWQLQPELQELGMSYFAPPGHLQTPDALWHNGGVHPFAALTGSRPGTG